MASVFQPSSLRNDSLIKIIFAQLKRPNKIMFGFFFPGRVFRLHQVSVFEQQAEHTSQSGQQAQLTEKIRSSSWH